MNYFTAAEQLRFDSKWIEQNGPLNTPCHSWQHPLDRDGYGTFWFRQRARRASRAGYFSVHGPIPEGMVIDHTCRNRACVNPEHLNLTTKKGNSLINSLGAGAVNAQKTRCPLGHPYDRSYKSKQGVVRYDSICHAAKVKKLRQEAKERPGFYDC